MRVRAHALLVIVVMLSGIVWALVSGDFRSEGRAMMASPWALVTLIDLYAGLTLFAAWVVYGEASLSRSLAWILALFALGNLGAGIYVLVRVARSAGDAQKFWMGNRHHAAQL